MMNTENELLVEQQLRKWDEELHAAAKILQGKYRDKFKVLITDVAKSLGCDLVETGKFQKADILPEHRLVIVGPPYGYEQRCSCGFKGPEDELVAHFAYHKAGQ